MPRRRALASGFQMVQARCLVVCTPGLLEVPQGSIEEAQSVAAIPTALWILVKTCIYNKAFRLCPGENSSTI